MSKSVERFLSHFSCRFVRVAQEYVGVTLILCRGRKETRIDPFTDVDTIRRVGVILQEITGESHSPEGKLPMFVTFKKVSKNWNRGRNFLKKPSSLSPVTVLRFVEGATGGFEKVRP